METTDALDRARKKVAQDGRPRFVCCYAGRYEIRIDQPTDRHCFEITADGVRFRNAERATLVR